ncbi:class I SAM-dependent methyltransferase [Flavobacteriaceae bacterium S0825]|uniref:class I SAM-dependent methyltransferase n=1 Tax=Gaetbulibacter sp. S0825 TaxID=2720084 RepID=UPI0014302EF3|nr:class I SAM-dependent methyltransferase [Gaetbulibacter sp. S0825]MCK0108263.1 class I SAM-dependent methyltransferase [Flavobacteriaceae bacterium S0825]NIX63899.1 class I SAM-dependent methyltransferase [Gaetbulibacter sp. S0825]
MKEIKPFLEVKDHSVSGETFQLIVNETYGFLETSPQPTKDQLSEYYKTEDYISHTDSKRNLFEKAYHLVRNISLKRKITLINSFNSEEKKLLDIGCGTGDFLKAAQDNNWYVSGIEPNHSARDIANKKTNNSVFNTEKIQQFKERSFDVITLWHVLEHLPNLEEQIITLTKLLKANGTLIIAVPNFNCFDANYYKDFWAAYDVPRHLWHFNQKSIASLFERKNMTVVKTLPMKFDAYYVSLLSEKYKTGFMNPLKAFWIGFRSNLKARRSNEHSSIIYIIKNK